MATDPLKQDTLSMSDLSNMYSVAAAVLNSDKSLQNALDQILKKKITDKALQQQIIMNTDWYKTTSEKSRIFEMAKAKDPATYAADLQTNASAIIRKWNQNGLTIDGATAVKYAENIMRGAVMKDGKTTVYDENYLNKMMAESINFEKSKTLKNGMVIYDFDGKLADAAEKLYQLADAYGYKSTVSNKGFQSWFEKSLSGLVSGAVNPQDIGDELKKNAMSAFPGLTDKINQGFTFREAADPWINALATEWEVDADQIDLNDDTLQRILNNQDEKGNIVPMNLYQAKTAARRNPKWQYTSKAKEEYTNIGKSLLQTFGFLG